MFRSAARFAPLLSFLLPVVLGAQPAYRGPAMARARVAPGVWVFSFDNALGDQGGVDATATVIINETDVVVVDAQWTPVTTRRVIGEIRKLTRLPVRYVVNTHWHGDHWLGNQAYSEAYPGVEFIAHPNTLADLEAQELPGLRSFADSVLPATIRTYQERVARGIRRDGAPYSARDSASALAQIAALRWVGPALSGIRPTRPTLLVTDSLVLTRGPRTIVIRHPGRGNTRGDLVVWLPEDSVLATGDLLVHPVPYSFGSYLGEWAKVLTSLRQLPARVVVPGHGAPLTDWSYLDQFVSLLQFTLAGTRAAVARGDDLEATRKSVDLRAFRERFAAGDERRGLAFDAFFITPAIERAWLEARGELDAAPPD